MPNGAAKEIFAPSPTLGASYGKSRTGGYSCPMCGWRRQFQRCFSGYFDLMINVRLLQSSPISYTRSIFLTVADLRTLRRT